MNGTLGFKLDVWFSPSHSPVRQSLHEQYPEFEMGFLHQFQTPDLVAISIRKDSYPIFSQYLWSLRKRL